MNYYIPTLYMSNFFIPLLKNQNDSVYWKFDVTFVQQFILIFF